MIIKIFNKKLPNINSLPKKPEILFLKTLKPKIFSLIGTDKVHQILLMK